MKRVDIEAIWERLRSDESMRTFLLNEYRAQLDPSATPTRERELYDSLCCSIRDRRSLLAEVERLQPEVILETERQEYERRIRMLRSAIDDDLQPEVERLQSSLSCIHCAAERDHGEALFCVDHIPTNWVVNYATPK